MNSILDQTIFSHIDPRSITPPVKKPMPFPLENFDEEISNAYQHAALIYAKLKAASENPINNTPARKRRLKSLKYKAKTCMSFLKEISNSCSDLWY